MMKRFKETIGAFGAVDLSDVLLRIERIEHQINGQLCDDGWVEIGDRLERGKKKILGVKDHMKFLEWRIRKLEHDMENITKGGHKK
jgi:hypothetical protein